jgi:hypothetical protein
MKDDLPDVSEGRKVRGASVVEVHGSSANEPMQAYCILSLSGPPPSRQNEPLLDQFNRLIHGGSVNSWAYSLTQIPGVNSSVFFRETATQAMTEGIEEMAVLLEKISPPLKAPARSPSNGTPPMQDERFRKYIDKYPSALFKAEPDVSQRLHTILGSKYDFFMERLQTEAPFKVIKGILVATGCKAHECGSEEAFLLIDLSGGKLHCAITSKGELTAFSESPDHFPEEALAITVSQNTF